MEDLIPHVVKAARIVLNNPSNQASVDHFELLKKQWTDNVEKLRGLVDDAIDSHAFIRENGLSTFIYFLLFFSDIVSLELSINLSANYYDYSLLPSFGQHSTSVFH